MAKTYIITGANGFLGNNIIREISRTEPDAKVRALVSSPNRADALADLNCEIFADDVTKPETLSRIFDLPKTDETYVIHCAAIVYIKSKPNPAVYQVNVLGTKNVAEKTLELGAKLIYVNSVHALPELPNNSEITEITNFDPKNVVGEYAKSKAEAARYVLETVQNRGLDACIVHPSGIIGPYDFKTSHLTQLIIDAATGRLRAGVKGGYDFVDVRDVVNGILATCARGQAGECFILSGHYVSIPELFQLIANVTGQKPIKTLLPLWLAKFTAPLSEIYYSLKKQPPLYTRYSLYTLESNANFSHAKATRKLDYHPRPISETITDTIHWLAETGKIPPITAQTPTTQTSVAQQPTPQTPANPEKSTKTSAGPEKPTETPSRPTKQP